MKNITCKKLILYVMISAVGSIMGFIFAWKIEENFYNIIPVIFLNTILFFFMIGIIEMFKSGKEKSEIESESKSDNKSENKQEYDLIISKANPQEKKLIQELAESYIKSQNPSFDASRSYYLQDEIKVVQDATQGFLLVNIFDTHWTGSEGNHYKYFLIIQTNEDKVMDNFPLKAAEEKTTSIFSFHANCFGPCFVYKNDNIDINSSPVFRAMYLYFNKENIV